MAVVIDVVVVVARAIVVVVIGRLVAMVVLGRVVMLVVQDLVQVRVQVLAVLWPLLAVQVLQQDLVQVMVQRRERVAVGGATLDMPGGGGDATLGWRRASWKSGTTGYVNK